jgi:hypothetical protein
MGDCKSNTIQTRTRVTDQVNEAASRTQAAAAAAAAAAAVLAISHKYLLWFQ